MSGVNATTELSQLEETIQGYERYVMPTYSRFQVAFERGEGPYLWDSEGRRYLDFLAGIAVNGVGHCHPHVIQAIQEQAAKLLHVSNLYLIPQQAALCETLCRLGEMDKAFLANSGAEANEAALKIARKHGKTISPKKDGLVSAQGSFHGRTLGTLTLTGQEKYQKPYMPLVPNATIVPWNDSAALEAAVDENTCAILLEPIQGESGVRPATREYLQTARALADKHQVFLIFDEVQTGFGRTGSMFAYKSYKVKPDILTCAKAMGGGFPIGACLAHGAAAEVFQPGDHGTTYGGGPLACAASLAALKVIEDERLDERAAVMGAKLREALEQLGAKYGALEVRGQGLMLAMVLKDPIARDVLNAAFEEGLLVNAIGEDILRFLPPLIINESHLNEAVGKLDIVFGRAKGQ